MAARPGLERPVADLVADWRGVFEDREDELRELLGIAEDATSPALTRSRQLGEVTIDASIAEGDLGRPSLGRPMFRYAETRSITGSLIGIVAGLGIGIATRHAGSHGVRPCGGKLVGEIRDPRQRLDAEEAYEEAQRTSPPS